ncbi:MAG: hypothetical protein QOJ07_510, partial [Thermoleophilaceae bacterium]|nr:hypothetical protein [Thermoleophilaceae bacterium]
PAGRPPAAETSAFETTGFEPGGPPVGPPPPLPPADEATSPFGSGPESAGPPPPPAFGGPPPPFGGSEGAPPPPGGFGGPPPPPGPPPPDPGPSPYSGPQGPPGPGYAPDPPGPPPLGGYPGGGQLAPGAPQPFPARDPIVEWLLCAFVPFYSLYWVYRANKDLEQWSGGRIEFNATSTILALVLGWIIIVPPFIAWASFMGRIREAQRMAGLPQTASFWGSVGRSLLLSYNIKWHQEQFNEIAARPPQY